MKKLMVAWSVLLVILVLLGAAELNTAKADAKTETADYFVSCDGDDGWSGTLANANSGRTDGPFKTVPQALRTAHVRALQEDHNGKPLVVCVRGGNYQLEKSLVLGPNCAGTMQTPIVLRGAAGEAAVFSGGIRIQNWKKKADGSWTASVLPGSGSMSQLFSNGRRLRRSRLPANDYFLPDAGDAFSVLGEPQLVYKVGTIEPTQQIFANAEVFVLDAFLTRRVAIQKIDSLSRAITVTAPPRRWWKLKPNTRFFIENVACLSEAGTWFSDTNDYQVSYRPAGPEPPNDAEMIMPRLENLLVLSRVSYLTIEGLKFAHSDWNNRTRYIADQAATGLPSAVVLRNCSDCCVRACSFEHTGGYALELKEGSTRCEVVGCTMKDLGGGGIKIGETSCSSSVVSRDNLVSNCLIAEGGRIQPESVGIWLGQTSGNKIEHNEITDFYYTGISVGWTWGYGASLSGNNIISYNHIHRIGQSLLSDLGGIYTLGISPGTVLDHNLIHGISSYDYGGRGIYFDEGTTGLCARNNVVYNIKSAGFCQHYGSDNLIQNNIFALGKEGLLERTRADSIKIPPNPELASFTLRQNIIYSEGGPVFLGQWDQMTYRLSSNLYWNTSTQNIVFPGRLNFADWQQQGQDKGSLIANPGFVSPDKGNFSAVTKITSKIGFQPIDISTAGRIGCKPYVSIAEPAFPKTKTAF